MFQQSTGPEAPLGALLGLLAAGGDRLRDLMRRRPARSAPLLPLDRRLHPGGRRRHSRRLLARAARGRVVESPAGHGLRPERRAAGRQRPRHRAGRHARLLRPPRGRRGGRSICCFWPSPSICSWLIPRAARPGRRAPRCVSSEGRAGHERDDDAAAAAHAAGPSPPACSCSWPALHSTMPRRVAVASAWPADAHHRDHRRQGLRARTLSRVPAGRRHVQDRQPVRPRGRVGDPGRRDGAWPSARTSRPGSPRRSPPSSCPAPTRSPAACSSNPRGTLVVTESAECGRRGDAPAVDARSSGHSRSTSSTCPWRRPSSSRRRVRSPRRSRLAIWSGARRIYLPARVAYGAIEPIAARFADLAAAIDGRRDYFERHEQDPGIQGLPSARVWLVLPSEHRRPGAGRRCADGGRRRNCKSRIAQPAASARTAGRLARPRRWPAWRRPGSRVAATAYAHIDLAVFQAEIDGSRQGGRAAPPAICPRPSPSWSASWMRQFAAVGGSIGQAAAAGRVRRRSTG